MVQPNSNTMVIVYERHMIDKITNRKISTGCRTNKEKFYILHNKQQNELHRIRHIIDRLQTGKVALNLQHKKKRLHFSETFNHIQIT